MDTANSHPSSPKERYRQECSHLPFYFNFLTEMIYPRLEMAALVSTASKLTELELPKDAVLLNGDSSKLQASLEKQWRCNYLQWVKCCYDTGTERMT